MPLRAPSGGKSLLYFSINQDCSCISIADFKGIQIYSLETHTPCYQVDIGAVSIAEMLFCTSLMAFVGAGEQPSLTPRKLTLMNTSTQNAIQDLSFSSSILAVRLNRRRMVVVLERRTYVHALETLALLRTLDTPSNPGGVCTLSPSSDPCLLALPSSSTTGAMRVYDVMVDGGNVLCELSAHKTPVVVMAWNADGTLLASASQKGTVLRVHRLPQAAKAYTFRRGTYPATIHSLAFTPPNVQPPLLCAASDHGTVHLFRLEESARHPAAVVASGLLASVMPPVMSDMVDPPRCIATVRLPCQAVPAICGLHAGHERAGINSSQIGMGGGDQPDSCSLVVVTAEGILYEYSIQQMSSLHPRCVLEKERHLLQRG